MKVRLTDTGHAAFEEHAVSEDAGEHALLAVLSEAEKRTLADLLRKLVVAAETGRTELSPAPPGPRRSRSAGR
ncbi:hypothetical protein [Streptomyces sp. NPDC002088]|uniref:hypothetical protein n=1 Tax=Streptomyces sp. NPDC002088 TaxID=3154665 RepID=UPI00331714CD